MGTSSIRVILIIKHPVGGYGFSIWIPALGEYYVKNTPQAEFKEFEPRLNLRRGSNLIDFTESFIQCLKI